MEICLAVKKEHPDRSRMFSIITTIVSTEWLHFRLFALLLQFYYRNKYRGEQIVFTKSQNSFA